MVAMHRLGVLALLLLVGCEPPEVGDPKPPNNPDVPMQQQTPKRLTSCPADFKDKQLALEPIDATCGYQAFTFVVDNRRIDCVSGEVQLAFWDATPRYWVLYWTPSQDLAQLVTATVPEEACSQGVKVTVLP